MKNHLCFGTTNIDSRTLPDTIGTRRYITKLSWAATIRVAASDGRVWDVECGTWTVIAKKVRITQ